MDYKIGQQVTYFGQNKYGCGGIQTVRVFKAVVIKVINHISLRIQYTNKNDKLITRKVQLEQIDSISRYEKMKVKFGLE